jgi:hypothetical protein
MLLAAHLHLQFSDPTLETKELLLESCLLSLKRCDLLLYTTVLCLLEIEVSLPVLKESYIYYSMRTS